MKAGYHNSFDVLVDAQEEQDRDALRERADRFERLSLAMLNDTGTEERPCGDFLAVQTFVRVPYDSLRIVLGFVDEATDYAALAHPGDPS